MYPPDQSSLLIGMYENAFLFQAGFVASEKWFRHSGLCTGGRAVAGADSLAGVTVRASKAVTDLNPVAAFAAAPFRDKRRQEESNLYRR
jgi:hypothetical protein